MYVSNVNVCAVLRIFCCLVFDVTVTIPTKQEKRCWAHVKDFTLFFPFVPHIYPLLLAMRWENRMEKWQNMAGSREVRPALLAGSREGIAARGSRRQSVKDRHKDMAPHQHR